MSKIRITWKRSMIGFEDDKRRTVKALGLKRLHQSVEHEDTPTIRGMVFRVQDMVTVEDVQEQSKAASRGSK